MSKSEEISSIENNDRKKEKDSKSEQPISPEVIESIPPEMQRVARWFFAASRSSGSINNPFLEKMNEGHIDKLIDIFSKDNDNDLKNVNSNRRYNFAYFFVVVGLFIFLTLQLSGSNAELYKEILKYLFIFTGGFGSGMGIQAYKDRKKS
jgi:hypothetical protein